MTNIQQQYMAKAFGHVTEVQQQSENVQKSYGTLCHQVPIWVLTNGLGPTVAFIDSKAKDLAFSLIRDHLADAIANNVAGAGLANHVRQLGTSDFMMATSTVVDAWIYYKRFAVSLLHVEVGDANLEEEL